MIAAAESGAVQGTQWLTPARLQWVMDVSTTTVQQWNSDGLIARFHHGRIIRYAPAAVLEFIARHTLAARGRIEARGWQIETPLLTAQAWERIERLIADQVRAQREAAGAVCQVSG